MENCEYMPQTPKQCCTVCSLNAGCLLKCKCHQPKPVFCGHEKKQYIPKKTASPASTEEWEKELVNIMRIHLCYTSLSLEFPDDVLRRLIDFIRSHDQQLRQRIVEEIEKKKKEHCGQKDCGQGQCVNRAARNKTLSDLLTFITNLK